MSVRIGTRNLKLCPDPAGERGRTIAAWLDAQDVDVWLLTEVHRDWETRGGRFVVSPPRAGSDQDTKRWAGIETRLPVGEVGTGADLAHPGEEGLCLARIAVDGWSLVVACSVLPWKGAGKYWPGLRLGQVGEFGHVLDHHVARIAAERLPGEALIWGGDFNQPLTLPFDGFTYAGADALANAFESFGLVALTEEVPSLNGRSFAIDHLAVSRELLVGGETAAVHRPPRGRPAAQRPCGVHRRTPVGPAARVNRPFGLRILSVPAATLPSVVAGAAARTGSG